MSQTQQPSRLSIREDRVLAHYRNEGDARQAADTLKTLGLSDTSSIMQHGNMFVFGFAAQAGHKAAEYLNALQVEGGAREAIAPHMKNAVIVAETKAALGGLKEVQHASADASNHVAHAAREQNQTITR